MNTKRKTVIRSKAPAVEFSESALLESVAGFVEQVKTGKIKNLRITDVVVAPRLPVRSAAQIRKLREKLGVSQSVFAAFLNVPIRTVASWENNQRHPSGAALKLLDIAARNPNALFK